MWNLDYSNRNELKETLSRYGYAMNKRFGQNFLLPFQTRKKIVDLMELGKGCFVWELGPGLGALTSILLSEKARVKAFEIDHGFASILKDDAFGDEEGFSLIEGDALKTMFKESEIPERIVGNLPYNVGSEMIARLIEEGILPELMVFTLQREVVSRMTGKEGTKDYSSFTVLVNLDYENKEALYIPRSSFYPEPNVDSAVVVMRRRGEKRMDDDKRKSFFSFVRTVFSSRRKTIRNNLSKRYSKEKLDDAFSLLSLSGMERGESLSTERLLALFDALER